MIRETKELLWWELKQKHCFKVMIYTQRNDFSHLLW